MPTERIAAFIKEQIVKKLDPIERALDAYFELDTDQKEAFDVLVRISKKQAAKLYAGLAPEAPAPKVGRPKGNKNRNVQVAEPFRSIVNAIAPNAAEKEGL